MEPRLAYLDAYLELPGEIREQACELNRRITASAGGSVDFGSGRIPHLTLYMGIFPEEEIPTISGALMDIAAATPPFPVAMRNIVPGKDGYIFWNVCSDPVLRQLHEKVVTALNPLRRGHIREKYLDDLKHFTTAERIHIMKYGFPWVLNLFRPHVTIGHVDEDRVSKAVELLKCPETSDTAFRLALGSVGEHGVVLKTVGIYPISSIVSPG